MYRPVDAIEVRVWDKKVGAIALDPKLGYYVFEYDPLFIRTGIELSPIALPLSAGHSPFIFTDLPEATYRRLPALCADSLPDDFGNAIVDAWMARKGVDKSKITALDRLAYMGKRGMGALAFKPARSPFTHTSTAIKLSRLVETARRAVRGDIGADQISKAALDQIIQVGTSAGGARAKAVIAWNPVTDEIRAGQFDADEGFEHWLLKFDGMGIDRELGGTQDYGRIEYAYYLMATMAGIAMAQSRLLLENERAHFMTKRFDREGGKKHHLQTLCAMAHLDYRQKGTHDYAQLFLTIQKLEMGFPEKEEAFRRMVFNVLAANCDDHTKNVSFMLKEGGEWRLSPAYDITFAHNPAGEWTKEHLMSVNGHFGAITREDLLAMAAQFGIGTAPDIISRVAGAVKIWPDFAMEAGVPEREIRRIAEIHRV